MPDAVLGRSEADESEKPGKRRWRAFLSGAVFVILAVVVCSLLAIEATESLSEPRSCARCHEMEEAYDTWTQSPHYVNPSGVKVTCVSCHLPPREDHIAHLTSKAWNGAKDVYVHVFGEYDAQAARRSVLQAMPSERCLHCHDNLLGMPSSSAVGIVHGVAIKQIPDRNHACVACHDALHGPRKTPIVKKKKYEAADNSFCYVCHIDFKTEKFVVDHKAAAVGCTACHGETLEHADDEDHLTPPDIMFLKKEVNASCMTDGCHAEARMREEIGHRPFYAGVDSERKYCTDCHGKHRIDERRQRWDKVTRKLIWREGYSLENDGKSGMR